MPRGVVKSKIVENLITNAVEEIKLLQDIFSEDEDEVEDTLDELYQDLCTVMKCRRSVENIVPKSVNWRNDILTSMDENRFRQMLRVDRTQFSHLLTLIADDEVFKMCATKQFSVDLQLAIILYRLGSSGESASIAKIATVFGIGDGGTLNIITKRVFAAFLRLLPQYIYWPDQTERAEITQATFHELPFCIGYVDGTEIKLAEAPVNHPEQFFSRKHIYSLPHPCT